MLEIRLSFMTEAVESKTHRVCQPQGEERKLMALEKDKMVRGPDDFRTSGLQVCHCLKNLFP